MPCATFGVQFDIAPTHLSARNKSVPYGRHSTKPCPTRMPTEGKGSVRFSPNAPSSDFFKQPLSRLLVVPNEEGTLVSLPRQEGRKGFGLTIVAENKNREQLSNALPKWAKMAGKSSTMTIDRRGGGR